jgi:hypothetical protein
VPAGQGSQVAKFVCENFPAGSGTFRARGPNTSATGLHSISTKRSIQIQLNIFVKKTRGMDRKKLKKLSEKDMQNTVELTILIWIRIFLCQQSLSEKPELKTKKHRFYYKYWPSCQMIMRAIRVYDDGKHFVPNFQKKHGLMCCKTL